MFYCCQNTLPAMRFYICYFFFNVIIRIGMMKNDSRISLSCRTSLYNNENDHANQVTKIKES